MCVFARACVRVIVRARDLERKACLMRCDHGPVCQCRNQCVSVSAHTLPPVCVCEREKVCVRVFATWMYVCESEKVCVCVSVCVVCGALVSAGERSVCVENVCCVRTFVCAEARDVRMCACVREMLRERGAEGGETEGGGWYICTCAHV